MILTVIFFIVMLIVIVISVDLLNFNMLSHILQSVVAPFWLAHS
jgi:hypothetical protein